MRIGVYAFAVAAMVVTGAFAAASGCGLDPLQAPADSPAGGQDASTVRRDAGGELTPEPIVDSGADADATTTPDADGDASVCPNTCSSCTGGVCEIDCSKGNCTKTVNCPTGMPCRIVCESPGCANTTINCASAQACTLRCSKADACSTVTLNGTFASKFCLQCSGQKSCSEISACNAGLNCTKACGNGGPDDNCGMGFGSACSGCSTVASCEP